MVFASEPYEISLFNLRFAVTETLYLSDMAYQDLLLYLLMVLENIWFRIILLTFIIETTINHRKLKRLAIQLNFLIKTKETKTSSKSFEILLFFKIVIDVIVIVALLVIESDAYPGDDEIFWLQLVDGVIYFSTINFIFYVYGIVNFLAQQEISVNIFHRSHFTEISNNMFKIYEIKENVDIIFEKTLLVFFGYNLVTLVVYVSVS